jgi:proline iminopeptidase
MVELYPPIEPYDQGMLDTGDGNLVYCAGTRTASRP